MTNFDLCEKVYAVLTKLQVETVVICAGARNAALIENLREQKFKAIYFFEERSAAFYALGLVKQSGKPVAVITTSGTAAAELLPAAIEAFYQNLPLILVTADRPQIYRDTGSPQAINQVGIYSHYVKQSFDWDCEQDYFGVKTTLQGPIHFNVCFDEPLLDRPNVAEQPVRVEIQKKIQFPVATEQQWDQVQDPLIIIGQIPDDKRNEVLTLIKKLRAPVYLEALSQMHGDSTISEWVLESSEVLIKKLFQEKICKSIVRVGAVPTVRFWRDLESQYKTVPVFNFTDLPFAGLARSSENYCVDFSNAVKCSSERSCPFIKNLIV